MKFKYGDIVRPSSEYIASGRAWEGIGKVDCAATSLYDGKPFFAVHFINLRSGGAGCLDLCKENEIELVPEEEIGGALLPEKDPNPLNYNYWLRKRREGIDG